MEFLRDETSCSHPPSPNTLNIVRISERQTWQAIATSFADYNYRQSWAYALEAAERKSAAVEHVAIRHGSSIIGAAAVRIRALPFLGIGVAYVSGGPLSRTERQSAPNFLRESIAALKWKYATCRGLSLRVAAPIQPNVTAEEVDDLFKSQGFVQQTDGRTYRTLVLDLERPLASVRECFDQKWRNCLNASERAQLDIVSGDGDDLFDQFCLLFNEFVARKGLTVDLDADFFRRIRRGCPSNEGYVVSLARVGGAPVAGHLAANHGDISVYLLGATNPLGLKRKASYLLQWHAIMASQRSGMRWYDLGGVDPDHNPGVWHFKLGMGGREIFAPGPYELINGRAKKRVLGFLEAMHRRLRR